MASIWAPASQDSSHVGNAGIGVVSLRGAPLALPTFATAQFRGFFDCGRAVRRMLPLGSGCLMHLVVLYGYQGADADAEQLALTEQLFDAGFGELSVVARVQPCLLVGDFNVEPTKIPCLAKGISAGLWVDFEEAWALAVGVRPAPTCKRSWTLLLLLLFFPAGFSLIGGLHTILRFGLFLTTAGGNVGLRSLFSASPFGLLLGCLFLMRVGAQSRLKFKGFGGFMMSVFRLCLVRTLCCWMSPLLQVIFLVLGLSGLGLLKLHMLMLFVSVVVPS